jgi:hypothetical protein
MTERMAPAHPYIPALGTGIEWTPTTVTLHERNKAPEVVSYATKSPWEFWYHLHFREAFPGVTHWWFRNFWTGGVKVSRPEPWMIKTDSVTGWVTFFKMLDQPRMPYTVFIEGPVVGVIPPYPPNAAQRANLPLRLTLARLIMGVVLGDIEPDRPFTVTSLVRAEHLDRAFPTTHRAAKEIYGNWRLAEGSEPIRRPLREELCWLLDLEPDREPERAEQAR